MDAMWEKPIVIKVLVTFTLISALYKPSFAGGQDVTGSEDKDVLLRLECAQDDDYEECGKDIILPSPSTRTPKRKLKICEYFRRDLMKISGILGAPYEEESVSMVLVWNEELEHAAAALLRATLLSECYSLESIEIRNKLTDPTNASDSLTVIVNLVPKLHVRLARRAVSEHPCATNASSDWSFYKNSSNLQQCAFIEPVANNENNIDLYILTKYEHDDVVDSIKKLTLELRPTIELSLTFIEPTELRNFIRESNKSFLFLDADREDYTNDDKVKIVQVQLCAPGNTLCALNRDKFVALTAHGKTPSKLFDIFQIFSPTQDDLNCVITLDIIMRDNLPEAACKWARLQFQMIREDNKWRNPAAAALTDSTTDWVAVVLLWEENSLTEYLHLLKLLHTTNTFPSTVEIKIFVAQRFDSQWFFRMLISWFSLKNIPKIKGAVLSNDMAADVGLLADKLNIPLLTYDVSSKPCEGLRVVTATGRQAHLVLALRRLFADCGWQRLAVLSEPSQLFVQLGEALRAPSAKLIIREVRIKHDLQNILLGLKEVNVRVILVNTGATMASLVLAAAQSLNMTRDAGYLWIVREYNAADNATAVMRPLSVSFWWRGDMTNESVIVKNMNVDDEKTPGNTMDESEKIQRERLKILHMHMEKRWHGRAWPLHAAPLVDSLLSLAAGLARKPLTDIRIFWHSLQESTIPGLVQELAYEDEGVIAPLVFVEQWGSEPRPRRLATWRGGEWSSISETCPVSNPPSDGSIKCFKPEGDPFLPTCRDTVWITSITSIALVTAAVISLAAWLSRRALALRELRFKKDFTKRLLARRERIFAELAEHLVDRKDLELQQELGTGRFGCVRLGVLRERHKRRTVVVAAKALREDAAPAEESEFLKEACVLADLHHEHIVLFVGVCVVDGPPLLLMEHAFFGDLLRYLQTRRHLTEGVESSDTIPDKVVGLEERAYVSAEALTRLAQEAAAALAYLAQRSLVHRDVRASNCLVDERRSLKLADFGLARTTGTVDGEYACRRRGFFPVPWMAPESLANGVSSASSDMWSFGVLVFELVTLGRRPYGSMPPPTVLQHVIGGGRPQLPWDASAETCALVRACWQRSPEARPHAAQLQRWLEEQRRALRPALATELVDVDNEIFGDRKLENPGLTPHSKTIQKPVKQSK